MSKFTQIPILALIAVLPACSPGSSNDDVAELPPPVIEGVWRASEVRLEAGPYAGFHSLDVQPNVYIFAGEHYALASVDGFAARSFLSLEPTEDEFGKAYAPFTGHMGTYAEQDNRLTLSPLVAKDPAMMDGATRIESNLNWIDGDVWLNTTTPTAGRVMTRLTPVPDHDVVLSPEEEKLQGVWRRVEKIVDRGEEAGRHLDDMQPGYYIFMGDKFVANFVTAFAPRPLLPEEPTDEEMGQVFSAYSSFGGRFDVNDDGVLQFWPAVTLNPNNMRGRPFQSIETEWADDGDVWFVYTGSDGAQNRTRLTKVSQIE